LEPNKDYLLNIKMLADKLSLKLTNKDTFNMDVIHDYIVLCFFLGNDFMPHFPSLNIRRNGIDVLMDAYNKCKCSNNDFSLTAKKELNWKNIKEIVELISEEEESLLKNETKYRNKMQSRYYPTNTIEEKEYKLTNMPIIDRIKETYINPEESGWEERYYDICLHMKRDKIRLNQICTNFMEALEWTYKYYRFGCQDWEWKYNYNYPPLLCDLKKYIPYFETIFIKEKQKNPIHHYVQLSYVLPPSSHHLLPKKIVEKLESIPECFPEDINMEYMYCRYLWEAHLNIEDVEINKLKEIII
jgi:5'-3' exonuclease